MTAKLSVLLAALLLSSCVGVSISTSQGIFSFQPHSNDINQPQIIKSVNHK